MKHTLYPMILIDAIDGIPKDIVLSQSKIHEIK